MSESPQRRGVMKRLPDASARPGLGGQPTGGRSCSRAQSCRRCSLPSSPSDAFHGSRQKPNGPGSSVWRAASSRRSTASSSCPGQMRKEKITRFATKIFGSAATAAIARQRGFGATSRRQSDANIERHGRACPGHPRLVAGWVEGSETRRHSCNATGFTALGASRPTHPCGLNVLRQPNSSQ